MSVLAPARRESALRRLEVAVCRRLDGILQGDYQGLVPGAGSEAGDGRAYAWGDDVRRIDWNLTARLGETHVRDTIADRELETWIVWDGSASLDFGTALCEKRDHALAAAAAFGLLTQKGGNRLGAVTTDHRATRVLPARSGRAFALGLLRALETGESRDAPPADDLARLIRRANLVSRRRGLIVVVSDFLDRSDWARELRVAGARHDVIAAHVVDPRELDLPPVGLLTLVDPETGRRREVQTSDRRLRARYAAAARVQQEQIHVTVRQAGATHLVLSTDRDWLPDVVQLVATRRRRR